MLDSIFKNVLLNGSVYNIVNKATNKYLDVENANKASGTALIQYEGNGGINQQFVLREKGSEEWELVPKVCEANAVDICGASPSENAAAQSYVRNDSRAQRFRLQMNKDGTYKILSACSGFAKALSVRGNSVSDRAAIVQAAVDGKTSDWKFIKVN